ncbi:hypothetical protein [Mesorhizobium sp.]|uniref:hypothetical protein n=1 Tax=Mesorhizobium sp. TaxID=1871066 RepID=UPI0025FDE3FF|nr:hypothetical protein [Mesorhizobium sp.]
MACAEIHWLAPKALPAQINTISLKYLWAGTLRRPTCTAYACLRLPVRFFAGDLAAGLAASTACMASLACLKRSVFRSRSAASPSMIWRAALVVASCFVSMAVGFGLNIPSGTGCCRI